MKVINEQYKIGDKIYCVRGHKEEQCDYRLKKNNFYTICEMTRSSEGYVHSIYLSEIDAPTYGFNPNRFRTLPEIRKYKIDKIKSRNGR